MTATIEHLDFQLRCEASGRFTAHCHQSAVTAVELPTGEPIGWHVLVCRRHAIQLQIEYLPRVLRAMLLTPQRRT